MSAYTADLGELENVVDHLLRFEQRVEEAMDEIDGQVARLHAQWSGAAADQHRAAHTRWRQGCAEMHEALGTMRSIVSVAHHNYSAAVSANVAMWRI